MKFTCYSCLQLKPASDASKRHPITKKTKRGTCKPCHREQNRFIQAKKLAAKNPEKYAMCNNCDRYFCYYQRNSKTKLTKCPHCNSTCIENYNMQGVN
jgi:hypothetical protein